LRLASGFTFSSDIFVQAVKTLSLSTVKVKPPITDEVCLVKDGSIGAQERIFRKTTLAISCAHMESLAFSLSISIVSTLNLSFTAKSGFGNFGQDGVIFTRGTRNGFKKPIKTLMITTMTLSK